jgi:hypothetical protein
LLAIEHIWRPGHWHPQAGKAHRVFLHAASFLAKQKMQGGRSKNGKWASKKCKGAGQKM